MKIGKDNLTLLFLLVAGLIFRIWVSPYYNHTSDIGLWIYWAHEIERIGFHDFFGIINWTDYLPFYFYILFIIQKLILAFTITNPLIFKMPAILADLGTAYLIYLLVRKWQFNYRFILPAAYLFNPAIFGNSSMWGQVDGVGAFLVTFSLYLFLKQKLILLGIFMAMAILFKPLYLLLLPIFLIAQLKYNHPQIKLNLSSFLKIIKPNILKNLLLIIFSTAISAFFLVLPFAKDFFLAPTLILERYSTSLGQYPYSSVNAFNFWAMLGKNFQSDQQTFLGINYHDWGLVIFAIIFTATLLSFLFMKVTSFSKFQRSLIMTLAISFFSIFIFATRAHERHLLTVFPFLALLCLQNRLLTSIYIFASALYVSNLLFGILYLYGGTFPFPNNEVTLYSGMLFITCLTLIFSFYSYLKHEEIA